MPAAEPALEAPRARLALVEDDEDLAFTLAFSLRRERYEVERFANGLVALEALTLRPPDLIILDLNLPDVDGLTVCRELRKADATRHVPVIMLTARAEERDKLLGFDLGADDYVTKPFSTKELLARIAANLRRAGGVEGSGELFELHDLKVDRARHQVSVAGHAVHLTKKEFDLLWLLIQSGGRVVTRETILSRLWDYAADVETRTVDVHIRSLRKKVGEERIETVVGVGYRFPR